jgi:hypothetical protein
MYFQGIEREIAVKKLVEPAFYEKLFFAHSKTGFAFLTDLPLAVRTLDERGQRYEIVLGVERYRLARKSGADTLPALVTEMSEEEARRYATGELLRIAALTASGNTVRLLIAARYNEECGGDWSVKKFMQT